MMLRFRKATVSDGMRSTKFVFQKRMLWRKTIMILSDKISRLRKKSGWSQEELADMLNVSRQAVSKWESRQSLPDVEKIIQMSRIFGVTTDYLLIDEIEDCGASDYGDKSDEETTASDSLEESDNKRRKVDLNDAESYLNIRKKASPLMALATFFCVISPVTLIYLAGMSENDHILLAEQAAVGIGLCMLLVLAAIGSALFVYCFSNSKDFEFLENEPFDLDVDAKELVLKRRADFRHTYSVCNLLGTVVCVLAAMPIFIAICFENEAFAQGDLIYVTAVCFVLIIAAIGSGIFVYSSTYWRAIEKLLQEGDFTEQKKEKTNIMNLVSGVYWCLMTAAFFISLFVFKNKNSWIIWPVAGVVFGAVSAVLDAVQKNKKNK